MVSRRGWGSSHAASFARKIFEVFANPRLQEPSFVTLVAERATSTLVLF